MAAFPIVDGRPYATVLLATDLTPSSDAATERAIELAAESTKSAAKAAASAGKGPIFFSRAFFSER